MSNDSLGDRMKGYEVASRTVLPGRLPVIIRVDGKAFHTYTRGTQRPFDVRLADVMIDTAKKLCESIQGAQLAYTQSDEISVLVHGYKKFNSSPWFDNQLQKMVSVAAGIASSHFTANSWKIWGSLDPEKSFTTWPPQVDAIRPAVFDARAFVVPEADVCNYFLWRQQDATRNSVQMLARSLFGHRQCENKNCDQLKTMIASRANMPGKTWEELELRWQRGVCVRKVYQTGPVGGWQPGDPEPTPRAHWEPDYRIPLFSQERDYVNKFLELEEE